MSKTLKDRIKEYGKRGVKTLCIGTISAGLLTPFGNKLQEKADPGPKPTIQKEYNIDKSELETSSYALNDFRESVVVSQNSEKVEGARRSENGLKEINLNSSLSYSSDKMVKKINSQTPSSKLGEKTDTTTGMLLDSLAKLPGENVFWKCYTQGLDPVGDFLDNIFSGFKRYTLSGKVEAKEIETKEELTACKNGYLSGVATNFVFEKFVDLPAPWKITLGLDFLNLGEDILRDYLISQEEK